MRSSSFFAGIVSEPACDVAERERRDAVTLTPACSTCSTAACIAAPLHAGQSPRTGTAARRARAIRTAPERGGFRRGPAAAVAFHRRATEPGDRRIVPTVPLAQPQKRARRLDRRRRVFTTGPLVRLVNLHRRIRFPVDREASARGGRTLGQGFGRLQPRSQVRQRDLRPARRRKSARRAGGPYSRARRRLRRRWSASAC